MNAAEGILTARGGMTSHAALVARQMGKVCVAGCGALEIDYVNRTMSVESGSNQAVLKEGDWLSVVQNQGSSAAIIEDRRLTQRCSGLVSLAAERQR